MPKALETDKELVKLLFHQGLKIPDIARQTGLNAGTIKTWSHRYGWHDTRNKAKELLGTVPKQVVAMEIAKDLAEQSKRAKEELANVVADQIKLLKANPAKTLAKLSGKNGLAATTQTIVNTAAKLHSWDSQGNRSLIQIGTLNQLKLDGYVAESSEQVVNPGSEQSEAIDV